MINCSKLFIFGGSGSLGNKIIKKYIDHCIVVNYSRDENKHWSMEIKYDSVNLKNIMGDIRDYNRVESSLLLENPEIIIIASALKHIDKCEYAINESLQTNLIGIKNVLDTVSKNKLYLTNLRCVCFVSTDKACSPVNVYGMCKALSEKMVIEKSLENPELKFVCVRYGNVLNSRGSIIPILHEIGKNEQREWYNLTDEKMSRFVMTLEQSVELIEHAVCYAESGDIVIPELVSMNVKDLFEIFSEKYNKPIKVTGLRAGEKLLESLINETQSARLVVGKGYYYIKPPYHKKIYNVNLCDYNSTINPLSKDDLRNYLAKLNLL